MNKLVRISRGIVGGVQGVTAVGIAIPRIATPEFADKTSENAQIIHAQTLSTMQPRSIRKEQQMLKMGNRDDRDVGFEFAGTPTGGSSVMNAAGAPGKGETVIGEHISIEGTIHADENIVIEGSMKGTIEVKSHQLTVGPKGHVEADVIADSVVISGHMTGNVVAKNKILVTKSADFSGQIKAKRIAVEDGAFIKASIELERDDKPSAGAKRPIDAVQFNNDEQSKKMSPEPAKSMPSK